MSKYFFCWWTAFFIICGVLFVSCSPAPDSENEHHQNQPPADDQTDDDTAGNDDVTDDDDDHAADSDWYRKVVFMEILTRSFQDSDGDGIGDLPGLTSRLAYLADLGIGGIWLTPIYPTPFVDSGYDVADYENINPDYGTLDDFLTFLDEAHARGLRVFMDGVFNHTSDRHPWFQESRSGRDNPKRDWYLWADEPLFDCVDPFAPNFGQNRWTFDEATGQYYYHHFNSRMPDLNYFNPEVGEAVKNVVRFWLDLGVDGFRLDVAHLYYEDENYCAHHPLTHRFLKELRDVVDEYSGRALIGEIAGTPKQDVAYFGNGSDELHMIFNFDLAYTMLGSIILHWPRPTDFIMDLMYGHFPAGGQQALTISNHDFFRYYGMLGQNVPLCKMASTIQMTLPGTPFVYYGEEIGMVNGTEIIIDYRDVARTPMQWDATANAGFTTGQSWIAMARNWPTNNVETESADPQSLLNHYRRLIKIHNETPALHLGGFTAIPSGSPRVYAFFRSGSDASVLVAINFSKKPESVAFDLSAGPWQDQVGDVSDLYAGTAYPDLDGETISDYPLDLPGYGFVLLALNAE